MKRSSYFIIALLLVLIAVSVYLFKSKSHLSTVDQDARNFSFKDTTALTKVFIADKEGNSSTLLKTKEGWVVNGKFKCRSEAVLNLLEVIKHVEVKMSVPKSGKQNVLKFMSSNAIKVELYVGDDKVKQYYIGHEPNDSEGRYMVLTNLEEDENYPDPYVCFIPGFKGILQPRFITRENEWRDRIVMNFIPPQIKKIKVEHFNQAKDSSFVIDMLDKSNFKLQDKSGSELSYDMALMRQYLIYFQNISYEVLLSGNNVKLQDSLNRVGPFSQITIHTTNNEVVEYRFYRKQFSGTVNPELGTTFEYDPDRMYMSFDRGKEWALVQYFVFGKLLVTFSYFSLPQSVKK